MNARYLARIVIIGCLILLSPGLTRAQDKPIIAVFDMEDRGSSLDKKTLDILTDYLAVRLVTCYNVIPREQLKQRLTARKVDSHKTCYEQSCQVEMGRELAAQKSLSSKILKIADECTMTATLYDLRKSITEKAAMAGGVCDKKTLLKTVGDIANELCGVAPQAKAWAVVPPREVKPAREVKPPRKTALTTPPPKVRKRPEKAVEEVTDSPADVQRSWNARIYLGFLIGNEELYYEDEFMEDWAEIDTAFRFRLDGEFMLGKYFSMGAYFSYSPATLSEWGYDIDFINVGLMFKPRYSFGALELRAALLLGYQNISPDAEDEDSADGLAVGALFEVAYWLSRNLGVVLGLGFMGQPVGGNDYADITHAPMFFMMFGAEFGG